MFKLLIIKEYQRLKEIETNKYNIEWNVKRILSKANYLIHTDAVKNYILPKTDYTKKHGMACLFRRSRCIKCFFPLCGFCCRLKQVPLKHFQ